MAVWNCIACRKKILESDHERAQIQIEVQGRFLRPRMLLVMACGDCARDIERAETFGDDAVITSELELAITRYVVALARKDGLAKKREEAEAMGPPPPVHKREPAGRRRDAKCRALAAGGKR